MPEQPTPITDRLSTDRPTTENGTHPSVTTSAKLHPARRRIATFDDYAEAERAVERLTSHDEVAADAARLLDREV